jgi:hypothetical protein
LNSINYYQGETRGDDTQHDHQRGGRLIGPAPALLAGKTSILLVTDKNVGALEATQAIHRLLAAEGRELRSLTRTGGAQPSRCGADRQPAGRQPAADGRWHRRGAYWM